jgi:hypothetical protein
MFLGVRRARVIEREGGGRKIVKQIKIKAVRERKRE